MAGEWRDTTLGDFVSLQRGHDLTDSERKPGTVPVMGSAGQNGFHDTAIAKGPGIVVGRSGASFGQIHYCESDYWPHNTALYVTDFRKNDPRFAFYFLKNIDFSRYNSGSAQPSLNRNFIYPIEVRVPPVGEQIAIAHILGTLDDKIELNRRMNETLEAMARAIFKSWFIDFDPVRRNSTRRRNQPSPAASRHPLPNGEGNAGMSPLSPSGRRDGDEGVINGDVFDHLFPNSFEDSELGEIPKGWIIKSIGDLADVVGGTTPTTQEPAYWEGGTHAWATPKDLSRLTVPVVFNTERRITDAGLSQIGSGLLPKGTVLLSSRAPIGYLAIAEIPVAINQGFIAMTPKTGTSNIFLLLWASVAHEEIVSRANGSTFLEISKASFRPIPVVTPSADVMRAFEELARPIYERIVESARESHTLAAMRDTLLPKLISGALRVRGLKKTIPGDGQREVDCDARMQP